VAPVVCKRASEKMKARDFALRLFSMEMLQAVDNLIPNRTSLVLPLHQIIDNNASIMRSRPMAQDQY